jgi:hypothetical protein
MKWLVWTACGLVILCSGCGSKGKSSKQNGDSIYLEGIALANEICDAIERDADPATIAEINKRIIENEDKMAALPQEEQYKLNKKYSEGIGKAGMRMAQVSIKHPGIQIGRIKMPDFNEMKRKMEDMKGKMAGKGFGDGTGTDVGKK